MGDSWILPSVLCTGVVWLVFKLLSIGRRDKALPPGPPTIPVLGNAHLIPSKFSFLRFSEWGRKYGGIYSVKVANATVIVLSDMKVVKELLDDRSSEMSSRPYFYVAEVLSSGYFFTLAPSGKFRGDLLIQWYPAESPVWRASRRAIQPFFNAQASPLRIPFLEREADILLRDILHKPDALSSHIDRYAFSSIIDFAFGKRVLQYDGPEMRDFQAYIRNFSKAVSPESAPVDLVPLLRYTPAFMAPWMKLWNETRTQQQSVYFSYLEYTEKRLSSGSKDQSIIQAILARREELGLTREMIGYTGGALIDAGTETISSTIQSLIICLAKSPRCLKKAQEEIDDLIGDKRLPIASDVDELPYIQAIIKEIHRFRPALPTGLPHAAIHDCHYQGYTIPKGSSIFINTWGIYHNPELFERPDEFWPERYLLTPDGTMPGLDKDYTIRPSLPFGSGKRLCPGIHFANISMDILVMRLVWGFDMAPRGRYAFQESVSWSLEEEYMDGLTLSPKRFDIAVNPRSSVRAKMIEESYKKVGEYGADNELAERLRSSLAVDES